MIASLASSISSVKHTKTAAKNSAKNYKKSVNKSKDRTHFESHSAQQLQTVHQPPEQSRIEFRPDEMLVGASSLLDSSKYQPYPNKI